MLVGKEEKGDKINELLGLLNFPVDRLKKRMNIFYFDEDIQTCALYHCDAHVVKMILESAQILCTVLWINNIPAPYRPTHQSHPCVLWANQSLANWNWLKDLSGALNEEYKYRFNRDKNHKSYDVVLALDPPPLPDLGLTKITQVLPDEYRHENPVLAYRQYFRGHKSHLAKWTKRDIPVWFME
ncbi:Uncharacterised protein [Legionella beliardensis]|uniref:Uncharacterized protein n=2 Tax=Legionella beliardensis TaxID=91822 RepID=A0A378I038_9GAMM|nr:Uncharacterised protein [Legionella beliardensis]